MSLPQVAITHPDIPGVIAYCTMLQFTTVWEPKGWELSDDLEGSALDQRLILSGPTADRPLATQVPANTLYFSDEGEVYRSDGGNWILYDFDVTPSTDETTNNTYIFGVKLTGGKPSTNYDDLPRISGGQP